MNRVAASLLLFVLMAAPVWTQPAAEPPPAGWRKAGQNAADYDVGLDSAIKRGGSASAFVKSRVPKPAGFGTLMQTIAAEEWKGKRIKLAGFIRTENVEQSAVLWLRIDGGNQRSLAFDNMMDRGVNGTSDWTPVSIVLDVAPAAVSISFGVMLAGAGHAWADDLTFEAVGLDTPTTTGPRLPKSPLNLDFERRPPRKP